MNFEFLLPEKEIQANKLESFGIKCNFCNIFTIKEALNHL